MKKHYLFKSVLLLFFSFLGMMAMKGQVKYVLNEGFEESDQLPNGWSQEYEVGPNTSWVVEKNGKNPIGGADGSDSRIMLRNTGLQTQGFVTKLITPPMDLRNSVITEPILVFSYAQEQSYGAVDELKLYFRPNPESTVWIELKSYTTNQKDWTTVTIPLTSVSDRMQIAFEGTDKGGKGIVLDNIMVRPKPICDTPEGVQAINATSTSFDITWFPIEADVHVKVSETPLSDIENAEGLVLDTVITFGKGYICPISNLEVNTTYYFYVKADCGDEQSAWSGVNSFTTKSVITQIPYTQNFDKDYNNTFTATEPTWTWKNKLGNAVYPYINSQVQEKDRGRYSNIGGGKSTAVVFAGSNNVEDPIPASEWAYIASPELVNHDLNKLQVTFTGTAYTYVESDYAAAIKVGVMTDPTNYGSFELIETVKIDSPNEFKTVTIPFDNYVGTGKYIAFLSFFDTQNLFYLDQVIIDSIPACQTVRGVHSQSTTPTSIDLVWNKATTASSYNVVVTTKAFANPSAATGADLVYSTTATTNSCQITTNLTAGNLYYAYVQAVCPNPTWSEAYIFKTPCSETLNLNYGFENTSEMSCLYASSIKTVPGIVSGNAVDGNSSLCLQGYGYEKVYVSFPTIDDFDDVWMSLHAKYVPTKSNPSSTSTPYNENVAKIEIGVMSNINEYSTFKSLETIELKVDYNQYFVDISKYTGSGKNIAIVLSPKNAGASTDYKVYIDNVGISKKEACSSPMQPKVEPGMTSAKFTWDSTGENNTYHIKISDSSIKNNEESGSSVYENNNITGTTFEVPEGILLPDGKEYFFYIKSNCNGVSSEWTFERTFKTLCFDKNTLPYTEDFSTYSASTTSSVVPLCWVTETTGNSSSWYPYVAQNKGFDDNRSLYLSTKNTSPAHSDYVALPGMNANVSQLQVNFMANLTRIDTLRVGVLSKQDDLKTFWLAQEITATAETEGIWQEYTVTFEGYIGDGFITFRSVDRYQGMDTKGAYIDNVTVDLRKSCIKPKNLKARNVQARSAELYWDKGLNENKWRLMVLNTNTVSPNNATSADIVLERDITSNPYTIDPVYLTPNTVYYYYLKSICSDTDSTDWTYNYGTFRTACMAIPVANMAETFEDGAPNFNCWLTGADKGLLPRIVYNSNSNRLLITSELDSKAYAAMPIIDISSTDMKTLQVSFDMYSTDVQGSNRREIEVGILTTPDDLGTLEVLKTIKVDKLNETKRYTVRFDKYTGDYNGNFGKRITFYSPSGESTTNEIYIDNIKVERIPECAEPTTIIESYFTDNGVYVKWDGEAGKTYRVVASKVSLTKEQLDETPDNENIIGQETVPASSVNVGLNGSFTSCYIYIQQECSPTEKSAWSNEYRLTAECQPSYPLPYVENFSGYNEGLKAWCWTSYYGSPTTPDNTYPQVSDKYNYTLGGASLYLYAHQGSLNGVSYNDYYCMAVSPKLDMNETAAYTLSFNLAQATSITQFPRFIVGLTDNPEVLNMNESFILVDTICIPAPTRIGSSAKLGKWYNFTVNLDLPAIANKTGMDISAYKYLVFATDSKKNTSKWTNISKTSGGFYLDNIEVREVPVACPKPKLVKLVSASNSSFEISWNKGGEETSWNVQYGVNGFTLGNGTVKSNVSDSTLEITGVNASTTYDIYVQAACGGSEWTGPYQLTTAPSIVDSYPYNYGFENTAENSKWTFTSGTAVNKWYIGDKLNKGGNQLFVSPDGNTAAYCESNVAPKYSAVWAMSPHTFHLSPGIYTVSFDWTNVGLQNFHYIRGGFVPTSCSVSPATSSHGSVLDADGTATAMTHTKGAGPSNWVRIEPDTLSNTNQLLGSGDNQWKTQKIKITITDNMNEYYNLVFYWYNNASKVQHSAPAAVDNIRIEREPCPAATNLRMSDFTSSSAKVTWNKLGRDQAGWTVRVVTEEVGMDTVSNAYLASITAVPEVTGLTSTSHNITGLNGNTTYFVYISAQCAGGTSEWKGTSFKTYCGPQPFPLTYTFNDADQLECWILGGTTTPRRVTDGTTVYSRQNGSGSALYFQSPINNSKGDFAVMPEVIGDMNEMQVRFFARAATHSLSTGLIDVTYSDPKRLSYTGEITVGTVTKQDDFNSFVPIKTIKLRDVLKDAAVSTDPHSFFTEAIVSLEGAAGKYVAFKSGGTKMNYIFLDEVRIEEKGGCNAPAKPTFGRIGANTAEINWGENDSYAQKWVVELASDQAMTNILRADTIKERKYLPYVIPNLEPLTRYYVRVYQECVISGVNYASAWSPVSEFRTATTMPFIEEFNAETHAPLGWSRYSTTGSNQFNETNRTINTVKQMTDVKTNVSRTMTWTRDDNYFDLDGAHQVKRVYSTASKSWFMTPAIEMPASDVISEDIWLSFDLALTDSLGKQISGTDLLGENNRFIVAISVDGGVTWDFDNTTVWDNKGSERVYNNIKPTWDMINIDISKYKGKVIKVGFYSETSGEIACTEIHIDNVYINKNKIVPPIDESICQYTDYEGHGFKKSYDELKVGLNNFRRFAIASDISDPDSIIVLNLTVDELQTRIINDAICEGVAYNKNGFNLAAEKEGTFRRIVEMGGGDCDSIIYLNLSRILTQKRTDTYSICQGDSLKWRNGVVYKSRPIEAPTWTVTSNITGCDTIFTLDLDVIPPKIYRFSKSICAGGSFQFYHDATKAPLTEPGTYRDTIQIPYNCDSIVIVDLTIRTEEKLNGVASEKICRGDVYSNYDFTDLPTNETGVFTYKRSNLTTPEGCDSTFTLTLTVLGGGDTVYHTVSKYENELPYTFESTGKTYPAGTKVGDHKDIVSVSSDDGACTSIVVTTLTVLKGNTGLSDLSYNLLIIPTLIERGGSVQVDFGEIPYGELNVEVYDTTGRTVFRKTSNTGLVEINAFPNTGIYVIKAISSQGDIKHGRVIVK